MGILSGITKSHISEGQTGSWNEGCWREGWRLRRTPPSCVSRHFSAPADEGHGRNGHHNTNMVEVTGEVLFYLSYVITEKRHFYWGKNYCMKSNFSFLKSNWKCALFTWNTRIIRAWWAEQNSSLSWILQSLVWDLCAGSYMASYTQ